MTLFLCFNCEGAGLVHDCRPEGCEYVPCGYCWATGETPWRDWDAYFDRDVTGVGTSRDDTYWMYGLRWEEGIRYWGLTR